MDFELNTDALVQAGQQAAMSNPDFAQIAGQLAKGTTTGASIGSLFVPPLGTAVGAALGAIASVISNVLPALERLFKGQCTITIAGQDADCGNYAGQNVQSAIDWVNANKPTAARMTPDALSTQAHVLVQDFADWYAALSPDYQSRIQSSGALDALKQLPGAQSILRAVQVPLAAGVAIASPELIALWAAVLPTNFPAILPTDVAAIVAAVQPVLDARVNAAIAWSNAQPIKPTAAQIRAQYPAFVPNDVNRIAAAPMTAQQRSNADIAAAKAGIVAQGGVTIGATAPAGTNISGVGVIPVVFQKNADGTYAKDAHGNLIIAKTPTLAEAMAAAGVQMPSATPTATVNSSGHTVIPIGGQPTITPGQAASIVAAVGTDPASAGFANDTIAAARAGNAIAAANAQLLTVADKLNTQANFVQKWAGKALADGIRTGYHLGVPAGSLAATIPSIPVPPPAAMTVATGPMKPLALFAAPAAPAPVHTTYALSMPITAPAPAPAPASAALHASTTIKLPTSILVARTAGRPSAWLRR